MLVRPLEVDVRDPVRRPVRPVAQDEGVGGPAVEPHVEDVEHLLPVVRVVVLAQEPRLGARRVPGVRALRLERRHDAGIDSWVAQQETVLRRLRADPRETGQRHAPGALTRENPVGTVLDHRMQAISPARRGPGHELVDRGQRPRPHRLAVFVLPVADGPVDRGEPLRAVEPDDRRLGPPAMRVRDRDAFARQQRLRTDQRVDDGLVRPARLAVGLQDRRAAEERQVRAEAAVRLDVVGHRQAVLDADPVVVVAMARRRVHEARARVVGDVLAREEGHLVVPLPAPAVRAPQGMRADQRRQLLGLDGPHAPPHAGREPGGREGRLGQRVGQQVGLPRLRPAFRGRARHLVEAVGDGGPEADRAVGRDRPRRRRPDRDPRRLELLLARQRRRHLDGARALHLLLLSIGRLGIVEVRLRGDHREGDPDRVRLPVVVLHLRLGQRGPLHRRPHHRLGPLVDEPRGEELLELRRDNRLGVEVHRQVRIGPVAGDPQPLELGTLHVDPAGREVPALLAELDHVDGVLVAALGAVGLLDLPLDRQAVTVPARHEGRVVAHHLTRADDHVLERLVERVADMEVPVGVGRPVMEREWLTARPGPGLLPQPVVHPDPRPAGQPVRLALGQARTHREVRRGQVQRRLVVGGIGLGRVGAHGGVLRIGTGGEVGAPARHPWPGRPGSGRRADASRRLARPPRHGAAYRTPGPRPARRRGPRAGTARARAARGNGTFTVVVQTWRRAAADGARPPPARETEDLPCPSPSSPPSRPPPSS